MNTLAQIRQRIAALPTVSPNKQALRDWLAASAPELQLGITLTLKQHTQRSTTSSYLNPNSYKVYVKLDEIHAGKIADDFMLRLNSEVFRTAAKRYGMSLYYVPMLEGRRKDERLHLHFGVGAVPKWLSAVDFYKAVGTAAKHTDWVDKQIDVMPADQFLCSYLTKTVGRYDTDAVLWQCIPESARVRAL